jgi:hypothetical protein
MRALCVGHASLGLIRLLFNVARLRRGVKAYFISSTRQSVALESPGKAT